MTSITTPVISAMVGKITRLITLALLISLMNPAAANNDFLIELIVFERYDRPQGNDEEQWGKNLRLEYPTPWQRLINPKEEANRRQAGEITPTDDFLQTLENERKAVSATEGASELAESESQPKYYEYLPQDKHSLRRTKEALNNSNQLRVLFHQAWTQPLTAPEKAPALILHGGNRYGDRFELQGFIRLGLSRFVHIETDLWFAQFVPNHGQESDHWPDLPIEPTDKQSNSAKQKDMSINQYETHERNTELTTSDGAWQTETGDVYIQTAEPAYLVKQIITLRQKRRMRSGETHYLDHPRLGVVIKVSSL